MVSYFLYVTKLGLPMVKMKPQDNTSVDTLKGEAALISNLHFWDFYPGPDSVHIQDNFHDLLVLNKGAIVIRLGIHVTIIGFKRQVVLDIASQMNVDTTKLNIKRVRVGHLSQNPA